MLKNYNELRNEINMLQGNINRICISDDIEEIKKMYEFAKRRIDDIYQYQISIKSGTDIGLKMEN